MRSITRSVAVATLFGFGFLAPAAWATPVLDQEYTPTPSIQYAAFSGGSFRRAETFTVGIAGTLAEITVDTTSSNSAFTGVNILSTSGGTPTTTVLDVGTFDSTNAAGVSTFTVSLPVTVGEVLGIEPMYCGPDLRQLAALIQAAKDSSPVLKLATRSCAPRT